MDAMECIFTRRSVRAFTEKDVSIETERTLLEAAMAAPSACNQQPWEFVVVRDPAHLAKVGDFNPYARMAAKAPLGILVCGDPTMEKCPGYWVQDCAAATQNLLLAARALGLGAVWTGILPEPTRVEGFRKLLNIPEHVVPTAFVVIGHPVQEQARTDRFRLDRVHQGGWRK